MAFMNYEFLNKMSICHSVQGVQLKQFKSCTPWSAFFWYKVAKKGLTIENWPIIFPSKPQSNYNKLEYDDLS